MNKKLYATFFILFAFVTLTKSQTKIKDGTVTGTSNLPNSSSILELESSNKGLLLPRVALTDTKSWSLTGSPVAGMVVYDTTTAITSSDNNYPILPGGQGEYYWDGTGWVAMKYTGAAWSTTGNSGTNPTSNFLGTTDGTDLVFRTSNSERMRILSDGTVGIGTSVTNGIGVVDALSNAVIGANNTADPEGGNVNYVMGNNDITNSGGGGGNSFSIVGSNNNTATGGGGGNSFSITGSNNIAGIGGGSCNYSIFGNNNNAGTGGGGSSNFLIFGDNNYSNSNGSGGNQPVIFGTNDTVNYSAFVYGHGVNYSGSPAVILGYNAPTIAVLPNGDVGVGTTTPTSTLQANGSFSLPIKSVTSAYTVTNADYKIVVRTTGTDTTLISLPNPASCLGRIYIIQNMNPNIHFNTTGSVAFNYPIDIGAGYTMPAGTPMLYTIVEQSPSAISGSGIVLQSDGSVWTGLQQ